LEDMAVTADGDGYLVIEIQGSEDGAEVDGGRTGCGEISGIQLFLRFLSVLLTV